MFWKDWSQFIFDQTDNSTATVCKYNNVQKPIESVVNFFIFFAKFLIHKQKYVNANLECYFFSVYESYWTSRITSLFLFWSLFLIVNPP